MIADFRLTPEQLLEWLASTGRSVTPRTLTDWRAKGLLLRLKGRSRGRAAGRAQYWDDPAVIGQAIILHDVLAGNRRTDFARWVLWFCGYDMDPNLVRTYWLQILKKEQFAGAAEPGELPADKYTLEIERLAAGLSKLEFLDANTAEPIAREVIIAGQELPEIPIREDEFEELLLASQTILKRFNRAKDMKLELTSEFLRQLLLLFRRFASHGALQRTLEKISPGELRRAQSYLCIVGSLLLAFVSADLNAALDEIEILELRRGLAPSFGNLLFEVILLIMTSGQERILRAAGHVVSRIQARIADPGRAYDGEADFWELVSIFRDLDWNRLYKSI